MCCWGCVRAGVRGGPGLVALAGGLAAGGEQPDVNVCIIVH